MIVENSQKNFARNSQQIKRSICLKLKNLLEKLIWKKTPKLFTDTFALSGVISQHKIIQCKLDLGKKRSNTDLR